MQPNVQGNAAANVVDVGSADTVGRGNSGSLARSETDAPQAREFEPKGRDTLGRFTPGNRAHETHGQHSRRFLARLEPALLEERRAILRAKGLTEADVDPVMARCIDGFVQAAFMMDGYFRHLVELGGPVSAKGRSRRAVEGWSRAADRLGRFAKVLGIERRPLQVESPAQWLTRVAAERQPAESEDVEVEPTEEPEP